MEKPIQVKTTVTKQYIGGRTEVIETTKDCKHPLDAHAVIREATKEAVLDAYHYMSWRYNMPEDDSWRLPRADKYDLTITHTISQD